MGIIVNEGGAALLTDVEARRIAKRWGARLPRREQRLLESIPTVEKQFRKPKCLYRDSFNRWLIADYEFIA